MRYIGGKSLMLNNIQNLVEHHTNGIASVIDAFAGSGVVSAFFKSAGYRVLSNDILYFCYVMARGSVGLNRKPSFGKLGIRRPIDYLNQLRIEDTPFSEEQCFIYRNYSPVDGCKRMYFQPQNALKIDIIRLTIQDWYDSGLIDDGGYYYLLGSLLNAVPYVSNIAGIYAAYLKFWDNRTYNALELKAPALVSNHRRNGCYNLDYHALLGRPCDLLYADPPYNSREYLPNYHVLETIARYDRPRISGVTGMREHQGNRSLFCSRRTVEQAFEDLINGTRARYLMISYNNEGLISTERLSEMCQDYAIAGSFHLYEYAYRRYKSKIPNEARNLKEQLYILRRH